MHKINNTEVTSEGCDWGVEFPDGFTYGTIDEKDARETSKLLGGKVVCRDVWVSAWAEVTE